MQVACACTDGRTYSHVTTNIFSSMFLNYGAPAGDARITSAMIQILHILYARTDLLNDAFFIRPDFKKAIFNIFLLEFSL